MESKAPLWSGYLKGVCVDQGGPTSWKENFMISVCSRYHGLHRI